MNALNTSAGTVVVAGGAQGRRIKLHFAIAKQTFTGTPVLSGVLCSRIAANIFPDSCAGY